MPRKRSTAALSTRDGRKEHQRVALDQPRFQTGHATVDEENQGRPLFLGNAQALQNAADGLAVSQRQPPLIPKALGKRLQFMVASNDNVHYVTDINPKTN